MDLKLLVALSLAAATIAAGVGIACLIRIEDLHRQLHGGSLRRRRAAGLRGWGRVLHLHDDPPHGRR